MVELVHRVGQNIRAGLFIRTHTHTHTRKHKNTHTEKNMHSHTIHSFVFIEQVKKISGSAELS